jgi:hypothetical protein
MNDTILKSLREKMNTVRESSALRSQQSSTPASNLRSLAQKARETFTDEDIQRLRRVNPST